MSLSWIAAHPRIDEPSMPNPSSKLASDTRWMGKETWCHSPGRSVKRRSSNFAPFSWANCRTDFGSACVADMFRRFLRSMKISARLRPEEIDCFYVEDKKDLWRASRQPNSLPKHEDSGNFMAAFSSLTWRQPFPGSLWPSHCSGQLARRGQNPEGPVHIASCAHTKRPGCYRPMKNSD